MNGKTFIYGLIDPRDNRLMYVGKANNTRKRYLQHLKPRSDQRMTPVKTWVLELASLGLFPGVVDLAECSLEDWGRVEKRFIDAYRNAGLASLNVANGGNEPMCPPETRAKNARSLERYCHDFAGIHWLARVLGRAALRSEKHGDSDRAARMRAAKTLVTRSAGEVRQRLDAYGRSRMGI